jgi:delta 1-pyrroline-5-carboxylate dehydrogenase
VFIHRLDTNELHPAAGDRSRRATSAHEPAGARRSWRAPGPDATDEQQAAGSPEEAEALRAERLHQERIERISAGVQEARERITVVSYENAEPGKEWKAVLQYGNRVLEAEAETAAAAADGVAHQVTDILQDEEDRAEQWALAAAASEAEQARQAAEVAALAAEQAADDTATKRARSRWARARG